MKNIEPDFLFWTDYEGVSENYRKKYDGDWKTIARHPMRYFHHKLSWWRVNRVIQKIEKPLELEQSKQLEKLNSLDLQWQKVIRKLEKDIKKIEKEAA